MKVQLKRSKCNYNEAYQDLDLFINQDYLF